jgi:hypothetical protein
MREAPDGFAELCRWTYDLARKRTSLSDRQRRQIADRWGIVVHPLQAEVEDAFPSEFLAELGRHDDLRRFMSVVSTVATLIAGMRTARRVSTNSEAWATVREALVEGVSSVLKEEKFALGHVVLARLLSDHEIPWSPKQQDILYALILQALSPTDSELVRAVQRICRGSELRKQDLPQIVAQMKAAGVELSTDAAHRRYYRALEELRSYADFLLHMRDRAIEKR